MKTWSLCFNNISVYKMVFTQALMEWTPYIVQTCQGTCLLFSRHNTMELPSDLPHLIFHAATKRIVYIQHVCWLSLGLPHHPLPEHLFCTFLLTQEQLRPRSKLGSPERKCKMDKYFSFRVILFIIKKTIC